jgi:hypothetical protein
MFMPDGRYLAETDGLIVGFVHSPSPLIEQVGGSGVDRYGQIILNPNPGFPLDAALRLFVKALPRGAAK